MINHIRTLLFNRSRGSAENELFYIDPGFSEIPVDGQLAQSMSTLFSGCNSEDQRCARAVCLARIADRPDLGFASDLFDGRNTLVGEEWLDDGFNVCSILSGARVSAVFRRTGDEMIDEALARLETVFTSTRTDGILESGAYILAIALQLESIRRGR